MLVYTLVHSVTEREVSLVLICHRLIAPTPKEKCAILYLPINDKGCCPRGKPTKPTAVCVCARHAFVSHSAAYNNVTAVQLVGICIIQRV